MIIFAHIRRFSAANASRHIRTNARNILLFSGRGAHIFTYHFGPGPDTSLVYGYLRRTCTFTCEACALRSIFPRESVNYKRETAKFFSPLEKAEIGLWPLDFSYCLGSKKIAI